MCDFEDKSQSLNKPTKLLIHLKWIQPYLRSTVEKTTNCFSPSGKRIMIKLKNIAEISVIGHMNDNDSGINLITKSGSLVKIKAQGWDHLKSKRETTKYQED